MTTKRGKKNRRPHDKDDEEEVRRAGKRARTKAESKVKELEKEFEQVQEELDDARNKVYDSQMYAETAATLKQWKRRVKSKTVWNAWFERYEADTIYDHSMMPSKEWGPAWHEYLHLTSTEARSVVDFALANDFEAETSGGNNFIIQLATAEEFKTMVERLQKLVASIPNLDHCIIEHGHGSDYILSVDMHRKCKADRQVNFEVLQQVLQGKIPGFPSDKLEQLKSLVPKPT